MLPLPGGWTLTGVDGEEKPAVLLGKLLIEVRPTNARLHYDVHVILVELHDLVHVCKINAYAAKGRCDVTLDTAATAEGDNGYPPLVADASDSTDLLRASGVSHSNW